MAPLTGADHPAGSYVKGSEQVGGSVTRVVVSTSLDLARTHGQQRRGTVQRLDTRFFVYTQYESLVRRVEVQPYDVSNLFDEKRIGGQFEGLCAMRLKGESSPDTAYGALAHAGASGHRTSAPVSSVVRCRLQCQSDDSLHVGVGDLAGRTRPRLVKQPIQASFDKSTTPLPHGLGREPHLSTHCFVGLTFGAAKYQPSTLGQRLRCLPKCDQSLQGFSLLCADFQRLQRSTTGYDFLQQQSQLMPTIILPTYDS